MSFPTRGNLNTNTLRVTSLYGVMIPRQTDQQIKAVIAGPVILDRIGYINPESHLRNFGIEAQRISGSAPEATYSKIVEKTDAFICFASLRSLVLPLSASQSFLAANKYDKPSFIGYDLLMSGRIPELEQFNVIGFDDASPEGYQALARYLLQPLEDRDSTTLLNHLSQQQQGEI